MKAYCFYLHMYLQATVVGISLVHVRACFIFSVDIWLNYLVILIMFNAQQQMKHKCMPIQERNKTYIIDNKWDIFNTQRIVLMRLISDTII